MAVAIISPDGAILGVHNKPRPTMVIPSGGRMIPYNQPDVDMDLVDVEPIEPVPADDSEVGFSVTPKPAEHVATVQAARIKAQIDELERAAILPRPMREYMIQDLEAKAAANSVTLADLRAANVNYRKVKDFDAQIAGLRQQIP